MAINGQSFQMLTQIIRPEIQPPACDLEWWRIAVFTLPRPLLDQWFWSANFSLPPVLARLCLRLSNDWQQVSVLI